MLRYRLVMGITTLHRQYQNTITVFANHKYFGSGLEIAPNTDLTDGLLECYQMRTGGFL